jgi:cellulase/cellobiase CelA1
VGRLTTCDGHADVTLSVDNDAYGTQEWAIRLKAPAGHCSPVSYAVGLPPYATGANVVGITRILRAGESDFIYLGRGFRTGRYPFRITATGYVEGCNTGRMQSWGVDYSFEVVPQ